LNCPPQSESLKQLTHKPLCGLQSWPVVAHDVPPSMRQLGKQSWSNPDGPHTLPAGQSLVLTQPQTPRGKQTLPVLAPTHWLGPVHRPQRPLAVSQEKGKLHCPPSASQRNAQAFAGVHTESPASPQSAVEWHPHVPLLGRQRGPEG
jgi:hypothetical protein